MSQVTPRGAVAPSLNITPLIDVVFLLIVFFMLVSNITSDEAVPMVLPDLVDSVTSELGDDPRVVVNIAPLPATGREFGMKGDPLDHAGEADFVKVGSLKTFPMSQLDAMTAELARIRAERPDVPILLRADGALYYSSVTPVIDAITKAQIADIKLVAYLPEDQR
ncbi:MAG: biopolymer transporter ExbD [Planctomycetota bacterium]